MIHPEGGDNKYCWRGSGQSGLQIGADGEGALSTQTTSNTATRLLPDPCRGCSRECARN
jgi:hypothetical protein